MIRVLSVFGTRPEAIKMAPVVRALQRAPERFESVVCVTAQHRAMLDQVLERLRAPGRPRPRLMAPGQTPGRHRRAGSSTGCRRCSAGSGPTSLLVQGDTTTTFAAAFAAFLERIPSAHVEAGLRTGDR